MVFSNLALSTRRRYNNCIALQVDIQDIDILDGSFSNQISHLGGYFLLPVSILKDQRRNTPSITIYFIRLEITDSMKYFIRLETIDSNDEIFHQT